MSTRPRNGQSGPRDGDGQSNPATARRVLRTALRLGVWALTAQLPRQLRARRDAARRQAAWAEACARWISQDTLTDAGRRALRQRIADLPRRPLISVLMPVFNPPPALLREAIASIRRQLYPDWELCIADDASTAPAIGEILRAAASEDPRIRVTFRPANGHIAACTNTALAMAQGELVALLDHDDVLAEHALARVAAEYAAHPDAELIYSDEDKLDAAGERADPYFKPGFDPELLRGQNMVNHLAVYRRALLDRLGGLRPGFEGSQDHDLALRAVAASDPARIRHIPAVLYHWRQTADSFSAGARDRCAEAARRAIAAAVPDATVTANPLAPHWARVVPPLPRPAPLVSVVIPLRAGAWPRRLLRDLRHRTAYAPMEIILVQAAAAADQATPRDGARRHPPPGFRLLHPPGAASRTALLNHGAAAARGEILLLLDSQARIIAPDWLEVLVRQALRPEIGAVGAKLLRRDGRVAEAGLWLDPVSVVRNPYEGWPGDAPGYFGHLLLERSVSAVSAACLAISRETFMALGGFDAVSLPDAYADTDFCLRLGARGLPTLWTPFARLALSGTVRHNADEAAATHMRTRWGDRLAADPYRPEGMPDLLASVLFGSSPGQSRRGAPPP
ncbi:MAG TPA: glycosyltransferase [Acetobacteraceae bacterium]|nr:glycosyltransferase [Acetobacteraceae bacterium]